MPKSHDSSASMVRLIQLMGQGFLYPDQAFHSLLASNSFQEQFGELTLELFGLPSTLGKCSVDYASWESRYIDLFHVGNKGAPVVSLNSGSFEELLCGQSRPQHLLNYTSWYKHFGLKPRENAQENVLPDHIACQLDFVAWLVHLENGAECRSTMENGYQRAQRDFLRRQLLPFLELLTADMRREMPARTEILFYQELADIAFHVATSRLRDLEHMLEPAR